MSEAVSGNESGHGHFKQSVIRTVYSVRSTQVDFDLSSDLLRGYILYTTSGRRGRLFHLLPEDPCIALTYLLLLLDCILTRYMLSESVKAFSPSVLASISRLGNHQAMQAMVVCQL